ncbi:hypothetical protein [Altererythrobacter lutimaris]|uniref:Uncharacterized protein n=1 Tax=Altererythrobacter lutimaris TaxID=2743979 RepID=A0A850H8X6_9SPHN|nr:hypothetical protein [Altererythrobacter lutimaris]NVE93685.1 hypothetical protein [Altererythrobacter lutimaris]
MSEFIRSAPQLAISHDPCTEPSDIRLVEADARPDANGTQQLAGQPVWLELLREGLTFDCVGLAPREASEAPKVNYRFDIEPHTPLESFESIILTPGKHLSGGGRSVPVLRGLLGLARDFVHHFKEAKVACWPPSQSAIGRRFFESTVTSWLDGGPFPALGLTAFADEADGSILSVGLSHFIDQELRIDPELAIDKLAATRLGLRLINQLVLVGGIDKSETIIGPDGSRLLLSPSRNGKFVRVSRE